MGQSFIRYPIILKSQYAFKCFSKIAWDLFKLALKPLARTLSINVAIMKDDTQVRAPSDLPHPTITLSTGVLKKCGFEFSHHQTQYKLIDFFWSRYVCSATFPTTHLLVATRCQMLEKINHVIPVVLLPMLPRISLPTPLVLICHYLTCNEHHHLLTSTTHWYGL